MERNKSTRTGVSVCVLSLTLSLASPARTLYVDDDGPADFNTIQAAIDAAAEGDIVLVAPGVYTGDGNRDIDFANKSIDMRSELGPESCIIDCDGSSDNPHRGFHLRATRPKPSAPLPVQSIDGFTVINGFADLGGGVYCSAGAPIIRNCIIAHNRAGVGGGVHCRTEAATFVNCVVSNNEATERGAGVYFGAGGRFVNCTFYENEVACVGHAYGVGTLENCIVWSPLYTELRGHPGPGSGAMSMRIVNCCIRPDMNDPWWSSRWNADCPCQPHLSDLYPIDPRCNLLTTDSPFVAESAGDLRLLPGSPCIDAGDLVSGLPETDIAGGPRVVDGDCDGTARPDIGAYEAEPPRAGYLLVSLDGLEFTATEDGPAPECQMLAIRNVGQSVLHWSTVRSEEWIEVDPPSGQLAAGVADWITVSVHHGGLGVGTHGGSLTIFDPCAVSPSREVRVTFTMAQTAYVPSQIPTIQEAIDAALPGAVIVVADGIYELPDTLDFRGKPVTLRSANGPEGCVLHLSSQSDREHAVVFANGEDARSVLEGFTLSGPARRSGSKGVYCESSGPTIRNCHIMDFQDGIFGNRACPTVASCLLTGNSSGLRSAGSPIVVNSIVFGNNHEGMGFSAGSPTVKNCILSQNHVGIRCGYTADVQIERCILEDNRRGAEVDAGSRTLIAGCTIVGNRSGLTLKDITFRKASARVVDSIVRDNQESSLLGFWQVTYCNVEGGWQGIGNLDVDPFFARPGHWDPNGTPDDVNDDFWVEGDYHLKSQAGRWDVASESWVIDDVTSPCIDAGDPNSPVGDEPEPNGGRINMGAYGGTAEASKSYTSAHEVMPGTSLIFTHAAW